jgi:hypothetical protein
MLSINIALDMAATHFGPPIHLQVSVEKVHKTGKQGIVLENT